MRTVVECIVIAFMMLTLYWNLTAVPKQDYTCCNNTWARP